MEKEFKSYWCDNMNQPKHTITFNHQLSQFEYDLITGGLINLCNNNPLTLTSYKINREKLEISCSDAIYQYLFGAIHFMSLIKCEK